MNCRQCGSEIAEKALVCYRCGAATTEPKFKPPSVRQERSTSSLITSALVVLLLALCLLYVTGFVAGASLPVLRWAIVLLAALTIGVRLFIRRSRR